MEVVKRKQSAIELGTRQIWVTGLILSLISSVSLDKP